MQLLDGLRGGRVAAQQPLLAGGAGVGVVRDAADSLLASLAGGVGAVLDLGHPALQHLALAHDRLLGVAQRLALGLQLGLDAIGAVGDAGDVGLALADA